MKLYRYDYATLSYKKIPWFRKYIIYTALLMVLFFALKTTERVYHHYFETENVLLVECENEFSEEKLIDKLKELNFRFPWIVLAQARRETGHYTSAIFRENKNLFGMKEAKTRLNLAQGTSRGHAFYNSWVESVYDYSLYSATYYSKCSSDEQYFQLLGQSYAESPTYVQDLKNDIRQNNLKELFKD
jgi:uncharacterized FlgJ-related protein